MKVIKVIIINNGIMSVRCFIINLIIMMFFYLYCILLNGSLYCDCVKDNFCKFLGVIIVIFLWVIGIKIFLLLICFKICWYVFECVFVFWILNVLLIFLYSCVLFLIFNVVFLYFVFVLNVVNVFWGLYNSFYVWLNIRL